jgi:hypothetical protein
MSKATPSKCEQKFTSMMVLIKRTIFSFKRSGEGERDRVVSDFDMDELNDEDVASGTESDTEQPKGGHRQMEFVKDKQAYIIYV